MDNYITFLGPSRATGYTNTQNMYTEAEGPNGKVYQCLMCHRSVNLMQNMKKHLETHAPESAVPKVSLEIEPRQDIKIEKVFSFNNISLCLYLNRKSNDLKRKSRSIKGFI